MDGPGEEVGSLEVFETVGLGVGAFEDFTTDPLGRVVLLGVELGTLESACVIFVEGVG